MIGVGSVKAKEENLNRQDAKCAKKMKSKRTRFVSLQVVLIACLLSVGVAVAQDDAPATEVIDAGNVARLGSVSRVDFGDLPEEAGEVENGWFSITVNAQQYAFLNSTSRIVFWHEKEGYIKTSTSDCARNGQSGGFIDGRFDGLGELFVAVYSGNASSYLIYHRFDKRPDVYDVTVCGSKNFPVSVWINGNWINRETRERSQTWIETLPANSTEQAYVEHHTVLVGLSGDVPVQSEFIYSVPSNDPESVIRIGRIEPPLAVTVTEDGRVKRWNMETGEVIAEVQIDVADGLPIYGAVNAGGDEYLVWRDPASTALHLLNFETGEDEKVVALDGMYMPFIFLSRTADVIIGVNVDDEPVVVAWDVATGTRYDLGEYRECKRPPDMVRLSQDGTTLVIGCDTGLDIWRVQ